MERSNEQWLQDLRSKGPARDAAIADLRRVLIAGLSRALAGSGYARRGELRELCKDFAQDSVVRIMDRLDSFHGLARFTTWSHKIAVRVALTELRRRRWKDVSIEEALAQGSGGLLDAEGSEDPSARAERRLVIDVLRRALRDELTERQRAALIAVAVRGMPVDEAARRLGTTRNALYKIVHDARVKLRRRMEREGTSVGELLEELGRR